MGLVLPHASISVTLVLCSTAFFLGRFTTHQVVPLSGIHAPEIQAEESTRHLGRRINQADGNKGIAGIDPLDPNSEQDLIRASGLTSVRPPVPAGGTGDSFLHVIPFQILSWYPRVVVYPNFIDKARREAIIKIANESMYPSTVAYRPQEAFDANQQTRTSTGAYLSPEDDPTGALKWLDERIAAASHIKAGHGEPYNVLHYQHLQHYDSHYDTFDPKEYGPQRSQRIVTVLTYLSVPEEGGETIFKREGQDAGERDIEDWRDCNDGSYKYIPRAGDALMFWAVKTNGDIDPHALHGGCPVKRGDKWVATKWIRSRPVFGKDDL